MAKLLSSGKDIGFTILPYFFNTSVQEELIANPSDYVLGYITHDNETGERKFTYTESGGFTEANNHWSLSILNQVPYYEQMCSWIVYNCPPEQTVLEFGKILKNSHETLHIRNWDTWSVEGKDATVAVINSWEIF